MNNKIKTEIGVGIILILSVVIGGIFYLGNKQSANMLPGNQSDKNTANITSDSSVQAKNFQLNCRKDWIEYRQDVLGIAFCYPSSWGKPDTEPLENITRLSTLKEDFKAQNIAYYNYIDINFKDNKKVNIRIFNDQNTGKSERNIDEPYLYYESGMTSDVINLKKSGDICDYNVGYNYRYSPDMKPNSLNAIYTNCVNEVKTILTEESKFFDFENTGMLYTYDLRFLAFKKLTNGYFDNVLITEDFDRADQIHENLSSLDEFFNATRTTEFENGILTKTKEQLEQERNEFQNFVSGIKVFSPSPIVPVFQQIPGEDSNITTIRKYYYLIASGKLDQAYAMYSQKPTDFAKYQEWYKNAMKADPRDFKNKGDGIFEFYVDYQENNNTSIIYHVTMQVANGKIKTIASEEITSEIVSFGPYTAFTKNIGDQNYIVLTENGKEIIIDKAGNDFEKQPDQVKIFSSPEFSPSGRYIKYFFSGSEWSETCIYDVKEKRKVANVYGIPKFGFTEEEKYVYFCEPPGMGSGVGEVFSLPDGKKVFDIYDQKGSDQYDHLDCEYIKDRNYIKFILSQNTINDFNFQPLSDKIIEFNLRK